MLGAVSKQENVPCTLKCHNDDEEEADQKKCLLVQNVSRVCVQQERKFVPRGKEMYIIHAPGDVFFFFGGPPRLRVFGCSLSRWAPSSVPDDDDVFDAVRLVEYAVAAAHNNSGGNCSHCTPKERKGKCGLYRGKKSRVSFGPSSISKG